MLWAAGLAAAALVVVAAGIGAADDTPPTENLVLWLRADAGVERTGERVAAWEDQSGRDHHARGEAGAAPIWVENAINGRPAVRFDGARSTLAIPHHPELNAGDGFSVFCVYRYSGGFRIAQKKDRSGGLVADAWFLAPQGGLGVSGRYWGGTFGPNRPHLQSTVFDGAAGSLSFFSLGERLTALNGIKPQQPNDDPIRLGKRDNPGGTEGHLKGDIAELLIYGAALPDAERERVEAYLQVKYDLSPPEEPSLTITRVIPGNRRVTVEWLRPEAEAERLRYEMAIKLRDAPWDEAVTVNTPDGQLWAGVSGLLNHADYMLRVVAEDAATGEQVGLSAERLVTPGPIPGVVIDYLHQHDPVYATFGQYIGSPSLARLQGGALVASHDIFGRGTDDFSRIFRSDDGGATWRHLSDVRPAFWGKLFVHRGELYLLASSTQYGDLVLHHSPDGGATWTKPAVIAPGRYHKAPMPVIEHEGRLWTCVELQTGGWPEGFQAVACSAPLGAGLMEPANWTVSEPLPYDPAWLPEGWELPEKTQGYLEGNAVVDPEGRLLNILRYNTTPHYGKAIVLRIAQDGKSLSFDRVIDFYGGMTKFTIRRHPESGVYWSLVNRVTTGAAGQRSVLSLVYSRDLDHWTPVRDVLRDDREFAVRYTGFQYVDWLFDGPDIIAACRMALNGAHNFHDANHLTFHRIEDFADNPRVLDP